MNNNKILLLSFCFILTNILVAQDIIPFDTLHWNLDGARIIKFQERNSVTGGEAELKNVLFENGVIEADIWIDGSKSYPGIVFRKKSNDEFEKIYLRPHKSGLYDDVVQYAPCFNGEICWQLYYGKGYTSEAKLKTNCWVHLKIEVNNDKARFYFDDMVNPILSVNSLAHGIGRGTIEINTWNDKVYFSNIKVTNTNNIGIQETENIDRLSGNIVNWEISEKINFKAFSKDDYPRFYTIFNTKWQQIEPEKNGLINISKYRSNTANDTSYIYARTIIKSDIDQVVKVGFGYSDAIKIFLNKKIVYSGNNAYRSRGLSYSGTIGIYDTLFLNLRKGLNELFLVSAENFGGWGFIFKSTSNLQTFIGGNQQISKIWELPQMDLCPESVLYDSLNDAVYFTNFDPKFYAQKTNCYISKANLKGEIINQRWIDTLFAPAGLCQFKDKLYALERENLVEIDIKTGKIINRYPYPPGIEFANDAVADDTGNIYITNTDTKTGATDIYIFTKNKIESWLNSVELAGLNGILYTNGELIVGNTNESLLQAVDIKTKGIRTIISLGSGTIDGIKTDGKGNFLVSLWEGQIFRISKSGEITKIFDSEGKFNTADFEYVRQQNLLLIPTFLNKNIIGLKMDTLHN